MKVEINDKNFKAIAKAIEQLQACEAGFFEKTSGVSKSGKKRPPNTQLAFWHEYGTKKMPARPFMRPTYDKNIGDYTEQIKNSFSANIFTEKPNVGNFNLTMAGIGKAYVKATRNTIDTKTTPPLAKSTLARKKKTTKRNATKLLKETEQMYYSMSYSLIAANASDARKKVVKEEKPKG